MMIYIFDHKFYIFKANSLEENIINKQQIVFNLNNLPLYLQKYYNIISKYSFEDEPDYNSLIQCFE